MNEREKTDFVPKHPLIPEEFGDYDRLDYGHPGGMGVVYKVLNRKLNVERALKVLRPDVADRMPVREAFIREANFGAQLAAGPYILPVHTVGTLQGWDFIEMDWVEGPNLAEFLRERGKLDPWAALTLCSMVLDALNYAHRAKIRYPDGSTKDGIIHRDIKPANILIDTRTSRPLLTDFGIALAREAARDRKGGYTAGTINYLPPELIQDRPVDERSDIYQVGLVLYELLAGQKAFPGGDAEGVPGNIMHGYKKRAVRLERQVKKLDAPVIGIVERALELDPADRVQSAGTMRDEIRTYLRRKYVDHDPQRAFSKYLKDGSVPARAFRESEAVKRAKKQVPRVLWTLLILAVVVAGIWGGRYLYVRHVKAEFEKERDNCAGQKMVWDKQEWSATQVDAVNQEWQEILRLGAAQDYRVARNRAIALGYQMRQEIEPLKRDADAARAQYEEELRVFMLQKWPKELVERINSSDSSTRNVISSEIYGKTRDVCQSQYQVLYHYDSTKTEEFRKSADQKETRRKYYADNYARRPCGDSAAALAAVLSRIRQDYGGQQRYQEGIEALDRIQIPVPGWKCVICDTCGREERERVRDSLQALLARLDEFKSRPNWNACSQSKRFAQCNVQAIEKWLSEAESLLGVRELGGVRVRTNSAMQCLDRLVSECSTRVDTADTIPPPPDNPDSAYARGKAAYDAARDRVAWASAYMLLEQVPDWHEMYRPARMMMANSLCYRGIYDQSTLARYQEAGPLCAGEDVLCYTCKIQCFAKFGWCDSVDAYYGMALGTGKLRCDNSDKAVLYGNSLICRFDCAYSRYLDARARGADDEKYNWGVVARDCCDAFLSCFSGRPEWKEKEDILRAQRNDITL